MSNDDTNTQRNSDSRELFDRARKQVESQPNWRMSYDVQTEMKKLTTQETAAIPVRSSSDLNRW